MRESLLPRGASTTGCRSDDNHVDTKTFRLYVHDVKALSEKDMADARARILGAGRRLFGRYGPAKTTVREVCAAAGIAAGSFYMFFPSKDELFSEILVEEVAEARDRNQRAAVADEGRVDASEVIRRFLYRLVADIERNPILAQFCYRESREDAKRALLSARGGAAFREISLGLTSQITAWRDAGLVKGEEAGLRRIVQALIFLAVNRSELGDGAGPDLVDAYIGFVANGIASHRAPDSVGGGGDDI